MGPSNDAVFGENEQIMGRSKEIPSLSEAKVTSTASTNAATTTTSDSVSQSRQLPNRNMLDTLLKERVDQMGFSLMKIVTESILNQIFMNAGTTRMPSTSDICRKEVHGRNEVNLTAQQSPIDYHIDESLLKELKLYKNILTSVKYQRDNYIMGKDYATKRRKDNAQNMNDVQEHNSISVPGSTSNKEEKEEANNLPLHIPYSPPVQTLAFHQLIHISQGFIPSQVMRNAIHPVVLWTISKPQKDRSPEGGPLRRTAIRAVKDVIPLSQSAVDDVVKTSIITILKDQTLKSQIKDSTESYVTSMQRDKGHGRTKAEENRTTRGRGHFVVTKTQID